MNSQPTLWGIHAGKYGAAHELFMTESCIALGWADAGDLSKLLPSDREAFKQAMALGYPQFKPGAIPVSAGQLFRFAHEVQAGDYVAYPSKSDRQVHLGRVTGAHYFDGSVLPAYPNRRRVQWMKAVPRIKLSQGALYEIGSALSFFQIKSYPDEYFALLEGKSSPVEVAQDATVGLVADEIEDVTRDYVIKNLAKELKGHPFAHFVGHLLNTMGYKTRVSPEGPDGGIDIVAHKDELGFEPPIVKVQIKSSEGTSGDPEVSSLYGKLSKEEYGLFVTLGSVSKQARNFERSRHNLRIIDGDELVDLVFQHYEQFDSRYKGLLPLKRVYVPAPVDIEG